MSAKRHGPPPLRSATFPDGLPGLSGAPLQRVRKANILYRFMVELILVLDSCSICWTVENPWASFLWETSYWKRIHKLRPVYCELHNCMFGGERMKRTCIASNNPAVMDLQVLCDGQHHHKPWLYQNGQFDTSKEAEYTPQLARALATTIMASLVDASQQAIFIVSAKRMKLSHSAAIGSQTQPQKALPELVPEFAHLLVLRGLPQDFQFQLDNKSNLTECVRISTVNTTLVHIPCGSKQLRLTIKKGEDRQFSWERVLAHSLQQFSDFSDGSMQFSIPGTAHNCACGVTAIRVVSEGDRERVWDQVDG